MKQTLPRLHVLGHLSSVPRWQAAVGIKEQLGKSARASGTHLNRAKRHLGLHFVFELRWLAATVCLAPRCLSSTLQRRILSHAPRRSGFVQTLSEHSLCVGHWDKPLAYITFIRTTPLYSRYCSVLILQTRRHLTCPGLELRSVQLLSPRHGLLSPAPQAQPEPANWFL